MKGRGSGRCLDVTNAGIPPIARPQLWDCLGDAQQQWLLEDPQLRVYGDKCPDAARDGRTNGTPVQIWYRSGAPQQQWSWRRGRHHPLAAQRALSRRRRRGDGQRHPASAVAVHGGERPVPG